MLVPSHSLGIKWDVVRNKVIGTSLCGGSLQRNSSVADWQGMMVDLACMETFTLEDPIPPV